MLESESSLYHHSNSDSLESKLSTIQFCTPDRLSLFENTNVLLIFIFYTQVLLKCIKCAGHSKSIFLVVDKNKIRFNSNMLSHY